jgi:hypothetical protein
MIERVGEFWLFNVFAFTGFIFAWYFASKRYAYTKREIFFLSGLWGLYGEHFLLQLGAGVIMTLFWILPTMCAYTLISAQPLLIFEGKHTKDAGKLKRYGIVLALMFLLSLPPIALLTQLRNTYPDAFPSCKNIPCAKQSD